MKKIQVLLIILFLFICASCAPKDNNKSIYPIIYSNEDINLYKVNDSLFIKEYREELDNTGESINNINEAERFFSNEGEIVFKETVRNRTRLLAVMQLASEKYKEAFEANIDLEKDMVTLIAKRDEAQKRLDANRGNIYEVGAQEEVDSINRTIAAREKNVKLIEEEGDAYIKLASAMELPKKPNINNSTVGNKN